MSSLSHFGQKKKKQALRRLSQQGATPRGSSSRSRVDQSKRAWPPRRRSREDSGDQFSPGRSGSRETKRTRSSAAYSGDSDSSSSTNLFAGRRIVQASDDSQNFVISKPVFTEPSDSDSDVSKSSVSNLGQGGAIDQPGGPTGSIFGRISSGHFGSDEAGNFGGSSSIKPATSDPRKQTSAASSNIFAKAFAAEEEESAPFNPFASRVTQISTKDGAKSGAGQVPPISTSSTFRFARPAAKDTSPPVKFAPPSSSIIGKSSFGKPESVEDAQRPSAAPTELETGETKPFSNFQFTIKQTGAGPTETSSTSASHVTGGAKDSASGGSHSSSMSAFTFRRPSAVSPTSADAKKPPFGFPPASKSDPSGSDSAGVFGIKADASPKSEPSAVRSFTFAKPKSDGFGSISSGSPVKRSASSFQPASESYTKRPITDWSDPFSESEEKDLSDLETFGADISKSPKKPGLVRSGLFGKAISDTRKESNRRSDRDDDRRDRGSRRGDDRRRREEDRGSGRDDRRRMEESRRRGDEENKTKTVSSMGIPASGRRYTSSDEIKQFKSIVIKNVPEVANNRTFLKRFFSKYGAVVKVSSMPSKSMAVIYYDNHDSAAAAKKSVRILKPNTKPVTINWHQSESSSRPVIGISRLSDKSSKTSSSTKDTTSSTRPLAPRNSADKAPAATKEKQLPVRKRDTSKMDPLKKQIGMSAQERRDILEARDKIIRQGYKKQSNIATAQALKGTCPDMCPEKERYLREVQRRLSGYETLDAQDEVHHPLAVKEYSRSSADQEEPLPHEMRPASVLMMTMNYLMNNIMNRGEVEGRWADWFDFLWNRTRAIRKDITQQHMCDLTAVELMEKCARFHIFCAHRLCDQDRTVFDPKINNENLTKCLQSLKQFYHDLANDDIYCPSEAEFRTYDVLLNLNEGDMLRQVQHYRPEVRGAEGVKFAVKAFYAVNSSNYVKFFKLVRSASYMNACSMHRYFTQMRSQAIVIMSKAYRNTHYPLDDVIRLLAFEGEVEATEFCEAHGLQVSDGTVRFKSSSFLEPESAIVAYRSVSIIEPKNDKSIGEIVNGAPLPPNYLHEPQSSFTDAGRYKGDITSSAAILGDDVLQKEEETGESLSSAGEDIVPCAVEKAEPPKRSHQYSNAAVKEVAKEMFLDVINGMARELSQNFLQWVQFVQTGSFELVNRVLGESLSDLSKEVAMEIYREEHMKVEREKKAKQRMLEQERLAQQRMLEQERQQRAEEEQRRRQMQEMERLRLESINRVSAEAMESIIDEVVKQESQNLAVAKYREVQAQLKHESIARSTEVVNSQILEEVLQQECHNVADDVIQTAIQQRDEKLAELEKCVLMSRTARYLQKWQRVYTLRVRLKRAQLTFPAAPPNQSLADQLQALWPSRERQVPGRVVGAVSGVTLDTPFSVLSGQQKVAKTILRRHYLTYLRKQRAWAPFNLPTMLHNILSQSQHASQLGINHLYWKLVISLPESGPRMSHDWSESFDWLQAKLKRGKLQGRFCEETLHDSDKVQTLSLYTATPEAQHSLPMSLCTKVTKGDVNDVLGCNQLLGTSALLFVVEDLEEAKEFVCNQLLGTSALLFVLEDLEETNLSEAYQRLDSLLEARPVHPPIPIMVVILNDQCNTSDVQGLVEKLSDLQHRGLLSLYQMMALTLDIEDPRASEELSEGIQWLATHCPHTPHLAEDTLRGYIDTGLMEMFNLPLHEDAKLRRKAGLPEQDAQYVVSLYNAVVAHLAAVASSESLKNLSWPVMEFAVAQKESELPKPNWNLPKALQQLRERIAGLQLPHMPNLHQDVNWKTVCESLHSYLLDQLPGREVDKAPLISRVQWLLDRSRRSFQNTCYLTSDTPGCEPTARHVPWTTIIEACITHMVTVMNTEDDDDDPVTVYYFEHEFDSFTSPQEWKDARNTTREDTYVQPNSINQSILETVQLKQTELAESQITDDMPYEGPVAKVKLEDDTPEVVAAKDTAEYLKIMIHAEKQETQRYEELLSSWLNDSSPKVDLQASMESTDESTPLRIHIPHWNDGKVVPPSVDVSVVKEDVTDAAGGKDETLSERLERLKQQIAMERRAEELEELRLAQLLGL